jgi:nicotinate phosphoribosyltransferase
MKLKPIINSLLEQDMYKYSMTMCVFHQFPDYTTTWSFKCRNKDVFFTPEMVEEIREQIKHYCTLRYTEDELAYLQAIPWLKKPYIDFLRFWHPRYEEFDISTNDPCGLAIRTSGSWLCTSFYEVVVLSIVNEVYFRMQYDYNELIQEFEKRLDEKIQCLIDGTYHLGNFSEFGLRRRLSGEAQRMAVKKLIENNDRFHKDDQRWSRFLGTSNVLLAKELNTKAMGTCAHEYILSFQGNPIYNPSYSNKLYLESWVKEFGIQNGIALTDTITTDCFLADLTAEYCQIFQGFRHDSGDAICWANKILARLNELGVDGKNKTLLFSDSLNFKKANDLFEALHDRCIFACGIGTFLANDTNQKALNIVMKPTTFNQYPVCKLSDEKGKSMCEDQEYVDYLKRCIKWRMEHE